MSSPILDIAILVSCLVVAATLFHPKVRTLRGWRATVTPLASIIGSGFLVVGPILDASFGYAAPVAMMALCGLAFLFGGAIRANIARIALTADNRSRPELFIERVSSWILIFAYVISVAYYLNLFGAFAVSLTDDGGSRFEARLVTTAVFFFIAVTGLIRGFDALEGLEKTSVSLKLAIIAGMMVGLVHFLADKVIADEVVINPPQAGGWTAVALVFGLLVTVQGFETSRYLGLEYTAETRIKSMKYAQFIASIIYVAYIGFLAFSFPANTIPLSETAIIYIFRVIAPILPALLIGAALLSQFSAAVADVVGAGGLLVEVTDGRVRPQIGYFLLGIVGLALTWSSSVFEIIGIASRAFALYYATQSAIAAIGDLQAGHRLQAGGFTLLAGLGLLIAATGTAVET